MQKQIEYTSRISKNTNLDRRQKVRIKSFSGCFDDHNDAKLPNRMTAA